MALTISPSHEINSKKRYYLFCLFYFFKLGGLGILVPYFQVYLDDISFSKTEIGILLSLFAVTRIYIPILWGKLADHYNSHSFLAGLNIFLSSLFFIGLFFFKSFFWIFIFLSLSMLFRTSVLPLMEASAHRFCDDFKFSYGKIRSWGTLGFLICLLAGGQLIENFGIQIILSLITGLGIVTAFILFSLRKDENKVQAKVEKKSTHIFKIPTFYKLALVAAVLMQFSHGAYYGFFSLYIKNFGYGDDFVSYFWTAALVPEILLLYYGHIIFKKISAYQLLIIAFSVATLRWLLVASVSSFDSHALLWFTQILHAVSYGAFHLAMMAIVQEYFGRERQGLGQSLYSSFTYGVGNTLGFIFQGKLGDHFSYEWMFGISAGISFIGLLVLLIFGKRAQSEK